MPLYEVQPAEPENCRRESNTRGFPDDSRGCGHHLGMGVLLDFHSGIVHEIFHPRLVPGDVMRGPIAGMAD